MFHVHLLSNFVCKIDGIDNGDVGLNQRGGFFVGEERYGLVGLGMVIMGLAGIRFLVCFLGGIIGVRRVLCF